MPSQPFLRLRAGSRAVETCEVCEPAKMVGSLIRTSETEHLMARADEFWNDCRPDEARSPRDKNTDLLPFFLVGRAGPSELQL